MLEIVSGWIQGILVERRRAKIRVIYKAEKPSSDPNDEALSRLIERLKRLSPIVEALENSSQGRTPSSATVRIVRGPADIIDIASRANFGGVRSFFTDATSESSNEKVE